MLKDSQVIIDVWHAVKPFIHAKERLDAADALVSVFDDYGFTDGIEEGDGLDKELKAALLSLGIEVESEEEEEDNDD